MRPHNSTRARVVKSKRHEEKASTEVGGSSLRMHTEDTNLKPRKRPGQKETCVRHQTYTKAEKTAEGKEVTNDWG